MDTIDSWFKDTCQEIQRLNYEIDAGLRIFTHGGITIDHVTVFNDAVAHRDKLTAQIMRYLAEQVKTQAPNQHETVTKPAPASALTMWSGCRAVSGRAESTLSNRAVCRALPFSTRPP
jgi:hypothetical protein